MVIAHLLQSFPLQVKVTSGRKACSEGRLHCKVHHGPVYDTPKNSTTLGGPNDDSSAISEMISEKKTLAKRFLLIVWVVVVQLNSLVYHTPKNSTVAAVTAGDHDGLLQGDHTVTY